ncbi:MAG: tetratricopeptide repeat protein [Elusimicrobia bacterium]|nr:tetratricopeptide repeat protein [Elusimicrobiota bacterium]
MKKLIQFSLILSAIIIIISVPGTPSIRDAQAANAMMIPFCPSCHKKWKDHCYMCKEPDNRLTDFAHLCDECFKKTGFISGAHGCGTPYKGWMRICSKCAAKNVCAKCGKPLGGKGASVGEDEKRVVERYKVRITIPGKKEKFLQYYNAANEAMKKKDYRQALDYFKKCNEIIPDGCACQIGIALRGLGKEEEAVKYFDIAIKNDPADYEAYFQKGLATLGQEGSEESLKKAIDLNVPYGDAYLMYAYLRESNKDKDQAVMYYEKGFELKPDEIKFRGNLIDLYKQDGRLDDALQQADISCKLSGNSLESLNIKGGILIDAKKWTDAIPVYEKILSMASTNVDVPYFFLGLSHYQLNHFEKARDNWKKAVEKDVNNYPEPYSCLALCEMKLKNPVEAEKYCETALKLTKNENSFVYYNLAGAYSLLNKTDKSIDLLEKALKTGRANIPQIEADADLINVRQTESYKKLVLKYK